jgi:hypothetical protein
MSGFLVEFISIKSSAAPGADKPGIMEGTAEVPHPIADAHLPEAASVFDAATALDTVMDMVAPQPTLVELLVRHVRLPREFLPQIGINSLVYAVFEGPRTWKIRSTKCSHVAGKEVDQQYPGGFWRSHYAGSTT